MKNNGDDFSKDDPMAETEFGSEMKREGRARFEETAEKFSGAAAEAWDQTRQKALVAREWTELLMRENPLPTVLGALALGLAVGLLIRYATRPEEPEPVTVRNALRRIDWSGASMPFLWPFFRRVRRTYDDSAEVVSDAVREGIDRVREVDVDRYVKPLRKQWKSWTR
jgi:ElaB/YqjD/DUF883 family membrane-anchored ribosome-binding protein